MQLVPSSLPDQNQDNSFSLESSKPKKRQVTADEYQARLEMIIRELIAATPRRLLIMSLMEKFQISRRQANRYIVDATALLNKNTSPSNHPLQALIVSRFEYLYSQALAQKDLSVAFNVNKATMQFSLKRLS